MKKLKGLLVRGSVYGIGAAQKGMEALLAKPERLMVFTMALGAFVALPHTAHAITQPTAGSFAYDIYDTVNNIVTGPIGFVAGIGAIAVGAFEAFRKQPLGAILPILGGAMLIKSEAITTSLGLIR